MTYNIPNTVTNEIGLKEYIQIKQNEVNQMVVGEMNKQVK
jgi:hypothetical protein